MPTIKALPLEPADREAFIRAAEDEFGDACLRIDWRDAIKARQNWNPATFVDQVLFFGLPLPVSRDYAFRLIGSALVRHINEDLVSPEDLRLH